MISLLEQYRVFEHPFLIYFAGEQVDSPAELFHGEGAEKMGFEVAGMDPDKAGEKLRELYGPEKFEQALREYVDRIFPAEGKQDIKDQLIANPATKYKYLFNHENGIYAAFNRAIADLEDAHDEAIASIERETREALYVLHVKVEAVRKAEGARPKEVNVPPWAAPKWFDQIPFISPPLPTEYQAYRRAEAGAQSEFKNHLEKTFEAYMTENAFDSDLGEILRTGMFLQVQGKIRLLFEEGKATAESLTQLQKNLIDQLSGYGALDGKPGDLSLEDLGKLRAQTPPLDEELINLADAGTSEEILKALEARHALSPEDWLTATTKATEDIIAEAVRNGNRQGLIDAVNTYGKENDPDFEDFTDFNQAAEYFKQAMGYRALAGVRETMEALEKFNTDINGERAGLLDDVAPALKGMVVNERDNLMSGITIPVPGSYDEAIVEFMRKSTREEREAILKDPAQRQRLFEAIRVIEVDYKKYYDNQKGNLPKKASELTTARDPTEGPKGHDTLARTKAVLILAGEAKWITENFDRDLQDLDFKEDWEKAEIIRRGREDVYLPNVTFRHVDKLYHVGYTSIAARSGFTFKNMGLTALKVWGGVTAAANVLNSFKEAHGLKNWDKAVEAALTNPFVYVGLGTVYGVNRLQENPKAIRAITGSPGERAEVATHVRLDSLGRRLGIDQLEEFIRTESEWNAMRHLKPRQVEKLIEKVRERSSTHPQITKEDLQELVPPEEWVHLPNDEAGQGNATRRFYFYSKFLTAETNIPQLQEHCTSWL